MEQVPFAPKHGCAISYMLGPKIRKEHENEMELIGIASFVVIFLSAVLWATRRPVDEHH